MDQKKLDMLLPKVYNSCIIIVPDTLLPYRRSDIDNSGAILPKIFGLNGVWFAQPTSDMISIIIIATILLKEIKSYEKEDIVEEVA